DSGASPASGRSSTTLCARRCASRQARRPPPRRSGWTARRSRPPTSADPRGTTGGKKVKGRKRFVAVDSLGLVWALMVVPASVQDRDGGCWLLALVRGLLARVREVIAAAGFSRRFVHWVRRNCGWPATSTPNAP